MSNDVRNDYMLVQNNMSQMGLRRVHIIHTQKLDERELVSQYVPYEAWSLVKHCQYQEDGLGVWHVHLAWNARDVISVPPEMRQALGIGDRAVLWWVGNSLYEPDKKSTIREACDLAGTLLWLRTGMAPTSCFIQKLPTGATTEVRIDLPKKQQVTATIAEADWCPAKYIFVAYSL